MFNRQPSPAFLASLAATTLVAGCVTPGTLFLEPPTQVPTDEKVVSIQSVATTRSISPVLPIRSVLSTGGGSLYTPSVEGESALHPNAERPVPRGESATAKRGYEKPSCTEELKFGRSALGFHCVYHKRLRVA